MQKIIEYRDPVTDKSITDSEAVARIYIEFSYNEEQ